MTKKIEIPKSIRLDILKYLFGKIKAQSYYLIDLLSGKENDELHYNSFNLFFNDPEKGFNSTSSNDFVTCIKEEFPGVEFNWVSDFTSQYYEDGVITWMWSFTYNDDECLAFITMDDNFETLQYEICKDV
jgi:hypothetical protein